MDDNFNKTLFETAIDSPDLQQAILKCIRKSAEGYSIPTGELRVSVFTLEDSPRREAIIQEIKEARELKVKDLARILGELRVDLLLDEVQDKELSAPEKTLRDIDIEALATWALIKWKARKKEASL